MAIEKLLSLNLGLEDIAAKLAKSKTFVVQRLCLNGPGKEWKDRFKKDEINLTVAIMIARSTKEHQKTMLDPAFDRNGEIKDKKAIGSAIENNLMLDLSKTVFDIESDELLPRCGSCTLCPKRSGFNTSLFADIKDDNCFDRTCFDKKTTAHLQKEVERIIEEGEPVPFIARNRGDVEEKLSNTITSQSLSVLEMWEDFRTNGKEKKKVKAIWVQGEDRGKFEDIVLIAKNADRKNAKVKMADLEPKDQIERIKGREVRSREIDAEKVQKDLVESFRECPKIIDVKNIAPLDADILLNRYIVWNSLGFHIAEKVGEGLGMARYPDFKEVFDALGKLTEVQFSYMVRMSAFSN